MQPDNIVSSPKNNKRLIITFIAIFIIAISSVGIVTFLKVLKNSKSGEGSSKSATTIITDLASNKELSALSDKNYDVQTNAAGSISYKNDDHNYRLDIQSNSALMYVAKKDTANNVTAVQSEMSSFMKVEGLAIDDGQTLGSTSNLKYITYKNDSAVCQLASYIPSESDSSIFHIVTCFDNTAIDAEYANIEKYLNLYGRSTGFYEVSFTTQKNDNMAYTILTLQSDGSSPRLLFAAIDDSWEYLGDMTAGGSEYATEKYSITPELEAKINDEKYKGFLASALL